MPLLQAFGVNAKSTPPCVIKLTWTQLLTYNTYLKHTDRHIHVTTFVFTKINISQYTVYFQDFITLKRKKSFLLNLKFFKQIFFLLFNICYFILVRRFIWKSTFVQGYKFCVNIRLSLHNFKPNGIKKHTFALFYLQIFSFH